MSTEAEAQFLSRSNVGAEAPTPYRPQRSHTHTQRTAWGHQEKENPRPTPQGWGTQNCDRGVVWAIRVECRSYGARFVGCCVSHTYTGLNSWHNSQRYMKKNADRFIVGGVRCGIWILRARAAAICFGARRIGVCLPGRRGRWRFGRWTYRRRSAG